MAYRATPVANSTGFGPYFLCFAKDMVLPFDNVIYPTGDVSPNFMPYCTQTLTRSQAAFHRAYLMHCGLTLTYCQTKLHIAASFYTSCYRFSTYMSINLKVNISSNSREPTNWIKC